MYSPHYSPHRKMTNQSTQPLLQRRPTLRLLEQKPRVALVVCEAGGGHRSAARAITHSIETLYPDTLDIETVAIEDLVGPFGKAVGMTLSNSYNWALKSGNYWMEPVIFQAMTTFRHLALPIGKSIPNRHIQSLNADMIVMLIHGAHDTFNEFYKAYGVIPNMTVVTDAVSIRPSWVHSSCEQVVVSTPEARQACVAQGVSADKIHLWGHPIDPKFARPPESDALLKQRYFLDSERFTLMIMMGGTGGKNIESFSRLIEEANLPVQILACCGSDKKLYNKMQQLSRQSQTPIKVFGYTEEIPELMAVSDLIVSKPGPGTIMEAMAMDLPLIIDDTNYTMWQEQGNLAFVERNGYGKVIDSIEDFIPTLKPLIENATLLEEMRQSIQREKRVNATEHIAKAIYHRLFHSDS